MRLYFDLDRGILVSTAGTSQAVSALTFKRGDTLPIVLSFHRGLTAVELDNAATGRVGIKSLGVYDGDYLAAAIGWTKTGTGAATLYSFALNLNTTAINDEMGVGAGDDVATLSCNFELEFVELDNITSSQTVRSIIHNDVNRGTEGTPLPSPTADEWLTARAVRFDESQTLTNAQKAQAAANLGFATYATIELANAGLAEIGTPFWDTTLHKYRSTTDIA